MLTPKTCTDISPQCPVGQEGGYVLGWRHGQVDMADTHDGTPCQVIAMQQEIERLRTALEFFASDENWLRDAKLDPNSGNFIGTLYARGALTPDTF